MQPWWSESATAWIGAIGGGGCGAMFGLYGSLAGILAPRGIGRRWMLAVHVLFLVLAAAAGAAGIIAVSIGQPYVVWFPLTLFGVIGTLVMLPLYFVIRMRYTEAEVRKMNAEELRSQGM
jgi:hypothetical protein